MADVSWEDNAGADTASPLGEYVMTPEEEAEAIAEGLLPAPVANAPALP
jgi:hypothetical protein